MDTKNLLKSLNAHNVQFIIIGATAGIAHGYSRLTRDLDIFIQPTPENAKRLFKALQQCGYDLMDTSIEEALAKKLLFRQYILELDVHPFVKGISFDQLWENKVSYQFYDEKVYFASLDDLIQMKKSAARPKDQEDLRVLREIKKQKS